MGYCRVLKVAMGDSNCGKARYSHSLGLFVDTWAWYLESEFEKVFLLECRQRQEKLRGVLERASRLVGILNETHGRHWDIRGTPEQMLGVFQLAIALQEGD